MSCWWAPALMRVIQRRRKSRFLFLRSRYAYFQPRSTLSLGLDQALDALGVTGRCDDTGLAEATLPLRSLLGQDVALEGLIPADLSGAGHLEALLGALVRFHLRHLNYLGSFRRENHGHRLPFQSSRALDFSNVRQRRS